MSSLSLFLVGIGVSVPAAAGIITLVFAAIADGRDNDRSQKELRGETERVG